MRHMLMSLTFMHSLMINIENSFLFVHGFNTMVEFMFLMAVSFEIELYFQIKATVLQSIHPYIHTYPDCDLFQ